MCVYITVNAAFLSLTGGDRESVLEALLQVSALSTLSADVLGIVAEYAAVMF